MQRHSAFRLNLRGCDQPPASILAGPFLPTGSILPTGPLLVTGPYLARVLLLVVGLLIATPANFVVAEPIDVADPGRPGAHVAPFKLAAINLQLETDTETAIVELKEKPAAAYTVVCFLGTECPLARLYAPRLNLLASEYAPHDVRIIGINSNRHDALDDVRNYVRDHRITFPIGKDYQNIVADQFGARRTPEVFVIDASRTIRYRGRIDDQYKPGLTRANATRHDLRQALDELLAGRDVSQPVTEPSGCLIGRVKDVPQHATTPSTVTFAKQVSRVLIQHCVECHRAGEIGPFALTEYDEVAGWADTIVETIDDGRMPPWHAAEGHRKFANARHMPEADKQLIRQWVAAGVPFGDPSDLPALPPVLAGWQLPREPDLVLEMRPQPYVVPATGTVEYQYFVVDPGFKEDKWVTAAEVVPGSRSVVHHGICFIRPPDGSTFRGVSWLTAYVPGQHGVALPPGAARRVPAGSKLVFQMHYTPNGTVQQDQTKIGLVFGRDEEVTHEVFTVVAIEQEFEIPPHAPNHVVTATVSSLPESGQLFAIVPHMHVRGKSVQITLQQGNTEQLLLNVPRYDFNWQHSYYLAEPVPLSSIEKIKMSATFDNSAANPTNPDPTQYVTWGDQTSEEMAIAFLAVAEPREGSTETTGSQSDIPADIQKTAAAKQAAAKQAAAKKAEKKAAAVEAFVVKFLERFDINRDGIVDRDEPPLSFQRFGFNKFDKNPHDGQLTEAEIRQAARDQL